MIIYTGVDDRCKDETCVKDMHLGVSHRRDPRLSSRKDEESVSNTG